MLGDLNLNHNGSRSFQQYRYHSSDTLTQEFGPSGTRETCMSSTPMGSRISICTKTQIRGDNRIKPPRKIKLLPLITHIHQMG